MKADFENDSTNNLAKRNMLVWLELGCWTAVALVPFVSLINGESVSIDQYIVRWIVIIVALFNAIGMRYRAMRL